MTARSNNFNLNEAQYLMFVAIAFFQKCRRNVAFHCFSINNGLTKTRLTLHFASGAEGGTRTRTGVHPLGPEPSASTNSATSAS